MLSTHHPSYLGQHLPSWLIDGNAALASVCSEANVMPVYAFLRGGNVEFKKCLQKDLQIYFPARTNTLHWQDWTSLKQNWYITSLFLISHPLFFWLNCEEKMFFEEDLKATTPCSSWAMTPEQRNQHATLGTDCVLLNQGLSAFLVSW